MSKVSYIKQKMILFISIFLVKFFCDGFLMVKLKFGLVNYIDYTIIFVLDI
jgi:hypothetical protein